MNWFKSKRSRFLWLWDLQWLRARVALARTKLGSQVPFFIFAGGVIFIGNGLRLIYSPLGWIFFGSILVWIALGKEKSDSLQSQELEVEELKRMASSRTPPRPGDKR